MYFKVQYENKYQSRITLWKMSPKINLSWFFCLPCTDKTIHACTIFLVPINSLNGNTRFSQLFCLNVWYWKRWLNSAWTCVFPNVWTKKLEKIKRTKKIQCFQQFFILFFFIFMLYSNGQRTMIQLEFVDRM